jgi:hypothetical protein
MALPSAQKLATFFVVFHLMIFVVNHVEISPGHYFNTGQIEPFQEYYDPLADMAASTQNIQNAMNNLGSNRTGNTVTVQACWSFLTTYCQPLSQDVTANAFGFVYGPFILMIDVVIALLFAGVSTCLNIFMVVIVMILTITVGAIPFWVTLFSFVDPTLGVVLGTAFGTIQMVYISLAIFRYGSAMIAGISRFL